MKNKPSFSFGDYFGYTELESMIDFLQNKFDFIDTGTLGNSIFNRKIYRLSVGKGEKSIIYIGAHHGMEWITAAILMRFLEELCEKYENGNTVFNISSRVLLETRRLHIIPMLNPDGIEYQIHGISTNHFLADRIMKMNKGSNDLSHWQANARGVDLNHNYNAGFKEYKIIERNLHIDNGAPTKYSGEYPESEPETRSICNFVRISQPELALTLHTQGEEIYYTSGEETANDSLTIAKTLSRLSGYKISFPSGTARYGGFTDWFIEEFNKPSFTIECGKGTNPLPFGDFDSIYCKINRALFTAPILI